MRVINDYPPLFKEIAAQFPIKPGTLFSWGDRIYYPGGGQIHPSIMAHEQVHGRRQGLLEPGIVLWWQRYMSDAKFRLDEEILGHQAELQWYLDNKGDSRQSRRRYTAIIASKLAAPLYGRLVSVTEAKRILTDGLARDQGSLQRSSIASIRRERSAAGVRPL